MTQVLLSLLIIKYVYYTKLYETKKCVERKQRNGEIVQYIKYIYEGPRFKRILCTVKM